MNQEPPRDESMQERAESETPETGEAVETEIAPEDVIALQTELDQYRDKYLRVQAEMENLRKRTRREIEEERRFANLPLIHDLLPVMDNINRAIDAAEKSQDAGSLLSGVKMMAQELHAVLSRFHCEEIAALHLPFDPAVHEAIAQQPSNEHPPGTVLTVAQAGYQLHDRVIRPTQVIVSVTPDGQPDGQAQE